MYQEWFKEYEKIKNEGKEKSENKGQAKSLDCLIFLF